MNPNLRRRSATAFTLIELLVVISIIVILIGLVVPMANRVRRSAWGAATDAELAAIGNAINQYYGDFHAYPGPLPNSQLGMAYYTNPAPAIGYPYVMNLAGTTNIPLTQPGGTAFPGTNGNQHVTGAENLVLGLLGGLEVQANAAGTDIQYFAYDSTIIFPNGPTPAPRGALSLNFTNPKRSSAYMQVSASDISNPAGNTMVAGNQFIDSAGRTSTDTMIPEFVDKYPESMPILYVRANVGATAIAGVGGCDDAGQPLKDNVQANTPLVTPQYDLAQVLDYTKSKIGTTANNMNLDHHNLQGLGVGGDGTAAMTDTISNPTKPGFNGLAYLKDPSNGGSFNTHAGNARQKDGYILISPGPDRLYGTADDIIYPGTLQP